MNNYNSAIVKTSINQERNTFSPNDNEGKTSSVQFQN